MSKYDSLRNPVYQIDYSNEAIGKYIASSKRLIRWSFGFSNSTAITKGKTGVACRGEEHDVVILWSVATGKCRIMYDNKEVYTSIRSGCQKFEWKVETMWNVQGTTHMLKVIANVVPSFSSHNRADAKVKQYDLQLDGMSFFDMPKIYELGFTKQLTPSEKDSYDSSTPPKTLLPSMNDSRLSINQQPGMPNTTHTSSSRTTIKESVRMNETKASPILADRSLENVTDIVIKQPEIDLLDLSASSHPVLTNVAKQSNPCNEFRNLSSSRPVPQMSEQLSPNIITLKQPPSPASTITSYSKEQQILQDQNQPEYVTVPSHFVQAAPWVEQTSKQGANNETKLPTEFHGVRAMTTAQPTLMYQTMQPYSFQPTTPLLSIQQVDSRDDSPCVEIHRAIQTLVNLDDISESMETPQQRLYQQMKQSQKEVNNSKSVPLPPKNPQRFVGTQPTLSMIAQSTISITTSSTKEVMRSPFLPQFGGTQDMMVVYGQPIVIGSSTSMGNKGAGFQPYAPSTGNFYQRY
jgi:hypothetical protein